LDGEAWAEESDGPPDRTSVREGELPRAWRRGESGDWIHEGVSRLADALRVHSGCHQRINLMHDQSRSNACDVE
jgi:hypothetical protein